MQQGMKRRSEGFAARPSALEAFARVGGFSDGWLAWFEFSELLVVNKRTRERICCGEAHIPPWEKMIRRLNRMNCTPREMRDQELEPFMSDPRVSSDFAGLSPEERFKKMMAFHQKCVSNLVSFYPDDLSASYANGAEWEFHDAGMQSLIVHNSQLATLVANLNSLAFAESDLRHGSYFYHTAFEGDSLDPATGSVYRDHFLHTMFEIVKRDDDGASDPFKVTAADVQGLEGRLRWFIEKKPSKIFGPMAQSIDFFARFRPSALESLNTLFPLHWMPMFGDKAAYERTRRTLVREKRSQT